MRWKFERADLEMYKCCFCCHVRTGTLFLGLLNLLGHVIGLSVIIITMTHPELVQNILHESASFPTSDTGLNNGLAGKLNNNGAAANNADFNIANVGIKLQDDLDSHRLSNSMNNVNIGLENTIANNLESNLSRDQFNPKMPHETWVKGRNWTFESYICAILLTVLSMMIAISLLYGTIKGESKYITPFLCVQMFDLCLSGLTMLSYFSDLAAVRRWISAQDSLPFKDQLMAMDNDHLTLLTLVIFVGALSIKAYFIGVVWTCYKYLKLYEIGAAGGQVRIRTYDHEAQQCPEDAEVLLPPKYEDVLLMPAPDNVAPPPAYSRQ